MPNILPPNVLTHITSKSQHVHSELMKHSLVNIQHSGNLLRLVGVKKYDEIGPGEARAIDKVLRLPRSTGS